jgi:hypothetical protein
MKVNSKRLCLFQSRINVFLCWKFDVWTIVTKLQDISSPAGATTTGNNYLDMLEMTMNCFRNIEHRPITAALFVMHSIRGFLANGREGEAQSFGLPDHQVWRPLTSSCTVLSDVPCMGVLGRWPTKITAPVETEAEVCTGWNELSARHLSCHETDAGENLLTKAFWVNLHFNKQFGSNSSTYDLYLGGARFESRSEYRLSSLRFSEDAILNYAIAASFHVHSKSLFTVIELFDTIYSELLTTWLSGLHINKKKSSMLCFVFYKYV